MGEVIKLPQADYFGNCPKCGENNGRLDIGADHWCVCHKHKFKWRVGTDIFSDWKEQAEDAWKENAEVLAGYKQVKPLYRFPKKKRD